MCVVHASEIKDIRRKEEGEEIEATTATFGVPPTNERTSEH